MSITLSLDVANDQYIILCNFGGGFEVMMGDLRSFRFLSQEANPRNKDVVEGNQSIFIFLILFSKNVCWSHLRLGGGGGGHLSMETFIRQNFACARSFKDGRPDSLV